MGENRRYDRSVVPDAVTDAEVRALRTIAGLVEAGTALVPDRVLAGKVGAVLRAAATELGAGRGLPIGLRQAIRHLAEEIRVGLDPRPGAGGR